MALQWDPSTDFYNGQSLGEIRENLNNYNSDVAIEVNTNTSNISSNTTRIITLEGVKETAIWGQISGTLSNQTDLQAAFDSKANVGDSYLKTDHLVVSSGSGDQGKPVVLDGTGKLHTSLIPSSTYYPVGSFTPTGGAEYPDTTGHSFGATWFVSGVNDSTGYEFTGGDLTGQTVYNDDRMIYGETSWVIEKREDNSQDYYRIDGTVSITAPFAGGNQQFKNAADGVDAKDLVTKAQLDGVNTSLSNHTGDTNNPHSVTKAQVGLDFVIDSGDGSQFLANDGTYKESTLPSGAIIMWSGVSIPSGWALCDGQNGTPDLRGRFVIGGEIGEIGVTGGSADSVVVSHNHIFTGNQVTGSLDSRGDSASGVSGVFTNVDGVFTIEIDGGAGNFASNETGSTSTTPDRVSLNFTPSGTISTEGESGTEKNLPPYYTLVYIMKL